MSWETGSVRIQELIDAGELGQVSPDEDLARRMLGDARRHLATAKHRGSGRPAAAATSPFRMPSSPSSGPASGPSAHSADSVARATASSIPARRPLVLRKTT
jgi:hypothetical protein